jgi:hypothetical protein
MISRKTLVIAICCAGIVLTCAASLRAASRQNKNEALHLTVLFEAPETCRVNVADHSFLLPQQGEALITFLKPLAENGRHASILGGIETPYRCIGQTIFTAQRAGFKKVGFVAEPPDGE